MSMKYYSSLVYMRSETHGITVVIVLMYFKRKELPHPDGTLSELVHPR